MVSLVHRIPSLSIYGIFREGHGSGNSEKMNSWSHKAFFQMNAMKTDEHDRLRYDKFVEMLRPLDFSLGRREVDWGRDSPKTRESTEGE